MKNSSDTGLFKQQIKALLAKHGPLKTRQLYSYIKADFPDRCDDMELDENNGEIAWKHRVRAAQEGLAKNKEIVRSEANGYWSLTGVEE